MVTHLMAMDALPTAEWLKKALYACSVWDKLTSVMCHVAMDKSMEMSSVMMATTSSSTAAVSPVKSRRVRTVATMGSSVFRKTLRRTQS